MVNDIAVQDFVNAIKEQPTDTNKTYNATVSRIDNEGVVWVNIHGSDKETPTASTSTEVKRGDAVTVNWRNNKLYIGGNYSNPSAGTNTVMPSVEYVTALIDRNVSVDSINSTTGYINDLTSERITAGDIQAATGYISELNADGIKASDITADHATVGSLSSTYATIDELHSDYAEIDLANVNNAWIQNGVVKDAAISDAQIIGVSANKLTAGTIDASNITVTNLNASNITTGSITVDGITIDVTNNEASIDGGYIEDGTITLNGLAQEVTDKIDGAIETFTGTVVPTLQNYPANTWSTAERATHVGDVYYVINAGNDADGYCYRFAKNGNTYEWILIKDSDVTAALSRLTTAEGNISGLQSFESETSAWITDTDEELSSIKTNHTSLETVVNKTVVETVQLWFTKANTTAPNKPTAHVTTNNASTANAWNLAVPTYNASYPNYYYCYEWKYVDGSYGWSSVTRDIAMGETQSTARTASSNASTALTNAATADGKAVAAQNTANANIKSSVQLWYTKANTTAPSKPTSQVTSTSTSGNAWRLVVPTYNSSYPYYYYCYQYQLGDGSYTWSDVVYDRATTENQSNSRDALSQVSTKVETSTFNTLSQTVDSNTANITSLTTITTNNGLTSSTNITNTVNEVSQTASGNSSKLSSLTQTLGTNADGTTKTGDIVHRTSAVEQDLSGITTRVGKTEVQILGQYATSSTAKGTAAKVATITPAVTGWTLYTGATITVKFTNENTATTPTLNINSTGAKQIRNYSASALTEAEYKWKAGSTFTFTYNGTYWLMQDSTVSTRINSAESSISQNAENIELKVSKNGVISSINQSAETVKIQASKVEIDGTAIFNAISDDVDDAITDKGYQTSSQVETAITNKGYQTASQVSTAITNGISGKADKTDAVSQTQRIYYRSNSTTAPTAPSTWVTSTSTANTTWTTKRMQYDSTYKYLWTCIQKQTVSGTITNTTVLLDDTTTVIDGGNIITGTVAANAVNASSGTFNTALIPNLSADKITAGTIAIDRMPSGTLNSEIEIGGRNLVGKTADYSGTATEGNIDIYHPANSAGSVGTYEMLDDPQFKTKVFHSTCSSSQSSSIADWLFKNAAYYIEPDSDYTFSFYAKGTGVMRSHLYKGGDSTVSKTTTSWGYNGTSSDGNTGDHALTSEWTKYWVVWHTLSTLDSSLLRNFIALRHLRPSSGSTDIYIAEIKLEKGNTATAWTPAPEDVQSEIDAKRSAHTFSTDYNYPYATILTVAAEGRSGGWDLSSGQTTENVKVLDTVRMKMTVSDMNSTPVYVTGTVTEVISTTQLRITSHGLDTTVIDGGNILTNSITAQQLNVTSINASKTLTVGAMTDAAASTILNSEVEIGGRNLLLDSSTGNGWSYDTFNKDTCEYTMSADTAAERTINANLKATVEEGQTYTLSCYAKSNGYVKSMDFYKFNASIQNVQYRGNIQVTTEYALYIWTFVANASETVTIRFDNNGTTTGGSTAILYIKNPKLEKGNKATDYTPAPEDVQTEIDAVESYTLESSYPYIELDTSGSDPTAVTVSAKYTKGSNAPAAYSGRFKIETSTDNANWATTYTSSANESSKTINTPTAVEDKTPYTFRAAPAGNLVDEKAIVGGTITWNQHVPTAYAHVQSSSSFEWVVIKTTYFKLVSGHKYLGALNGTTVANGNIGLRDTTNGIVYRPQTGYAFIYSSSITTAGNSAFFQGSWDEGTTDAYLQFFDLTQMFGSTVADYLYALETATAGAGVAWFRKLFPNSYYEYNAGELMSVNTTSHDMVGFNQWDEEWESGAISASTGNPSTNANYVRSKNFCRILPNTSYYRGSGTVTNLGMFWYDANKTYIGVNYYSSAQTFTTPANAHYFKLHYEGTTYADNICINISSARNGEYEPYKKNTYPLADVELRGLPKLDSSNNLYYDGDTYEPNGTITRKYGAVDLGTLTWTYSSTYNRFGASVSGAITGANSVNLRCAKYIAKAVMADGNAWLNGGSVYIVDSSYTSAASFKTAMSGVMLVYELATPETENADPYNQIQISGSTEEYITKNLVPVGHNSSYSSAIKAIRASLYKAGGTTTLLAQTVIPCRTTSVGLAGVAAQAANEASAKADDVADDATAAINKLSEDTAKSLTDAKGELEGKINAVSAQLSSRATQKQLDEVDEKLTEWFGEDGYLNFVGGVLTIGKGNVDVAITGDIIAFRQNGATVAYISSNKLFIPKAELTKEFRMGNFVWQPMGGQLVLAYSPET